MQSDKKRLIGLIFWILAFILSLIVFPLGKAKAEAPTIELKDQPIEAIVAHFAEVNGIDAKLAITVMYCESKGNQSAISDGGRSVGIFQYQLPTWERHTEEFGEKLDIHSPYDQAKIATWSLAHGKGNEWTAYRAIKNGGTYSFYSTQLKKHFTVKCSM